MHSKWGQDDKIYHLYITTSQSHIHSVIIHVSFYLGTFNYTHGQSQLLIVSGLLFTVFYTHSTLSIVCTGIRISTEMRITILSLVLVSALTVVVSNSVLYNNYMIDTISRVVILHNKLLHCCMDCRCNWRDVDCRECRCIDLGTHIGSRHHQWPTYKMDCSLLLKQTIKSNFGQVCRFCGL